MSRVRVCFFGTPNFAVTCLEALLRDEHFEVVGVVTQPDRPSGRKLNLSPTPVKMLALQKGIPIVSPDSLKSSPMIMDAIRSWRAEIGVVVAYGQILTEEFMASFNFGCVNVHASLLPRWRGAAPIQRSLEAGDKETGVCLQRMVKKLDAGDVLGNRRIELDLEINAQELHDRLALLGADLLRVEMMDYLRGNLAPVQQDDRLVTYAKKIEKTEAKIDLQQSALVLHNKIRAFVMGPGTYVIHEGKKLKIHRSKLVPIQFSKNVTGITPGKIIENIQSYNQEGILIQTGQGILEILEVQPESRNRMSAQDYFRQIKVFEMQ